MSLKLSLFPGKYELSKLIFNFFKNLLIVYLLLLIFDYLSSGNVEFYFDLNNLIYPLIVLGAASLVIYAKKFEKIDKIEFDKINKCISYFFLGLLLTRAAQSISTQIVPERIRLPLMVATIVFGSITFYLNKDKLNKIENGVLEDDEEKRRVMEFVGMFPRVNRVWGIRWVVKWMHKEGWWHSILFLLVLGISLGFMLNHLGQFMSVDEPKWFHTRVPQLYDSIFEGDLEGTYINDKPGILPAALSGLTFLILDPSNYSAETLDQILFFWRLPIVLFNVIMLVFIYNYLKKLINQDFAILCFSFIALNPIIIGLSQTVNPDATLWSTGFICLLTFFLYLKTYLQSYIYISGFFLGLALLSKYFITVFYPFFLLAVVIEYLMNKNFEIGHLLTRIYDISILVAISIIIYTFFFPATWINPEQILKGTLGAGILRSGYFLLIPGLFFFFFDVLILKGRFLYFIRQKEILNTSIRLLSMIALISLFYLFFNLFSDYSFFNLGDFLFNFDNKNDYSKLELLQASSYILILTVTPFILLGLLSFFIINSVKGIDFFKAKQNTISNIILNSGVILIFIYIMGSSFGGYITSARYQVILYPIYSIITTTVIVSLIKKENILRIVIILIIISNIYILYNTAPFYIHYTNKMNIHSTVIADAWGFGGYELAQMANKLPDARNLTVWSDREGFNEFFIGRTYWRGKANPFENEDIDYLVLTYGGKKIFTKGLINWNKGGNYLYARVAGETPLLEYYNETTINQINVNNKNNYYKLIKVEDSDRKKIKNETLLNNSSSIMTLQ